MRLGTMRLAIVCLLVLWPLTAQTSDEKDVLAAVQKTFDGMASNDAAKILASMTADARLYGVRATGAAYAIPAEQWAARIASLKSALVERFTKAPVVTIHGTVANVWGEYEFLRDGKFGHCGVDSFNLLKTSDGWKVATVLDTEETTGCPTQPAQPAYFPAAQWRTATPESQGVDSTALAAAVDQVREKHLGVHSLLVIRHGYLLADAYFYPYAPSAPHDLASVTKTITSTLTGIAVGQGLIKLDDKLLPFFPNESPAGAEPAKQRITLGDMVRMESGLECGYAPGEQELERMKRSPDWVRFALGLPMKYDPGTHSAYCSPGYHLLGSALASAARQSERDFAVKALFEPLGIGKVLWATDPQGRSHGWGDCHLFPLDVARIGYLFLHDGEWNGKQIVPRDWVAMSTAVPKAPRGEAGGMGYEWNAVNGPNGRQYGGTGRGGQSLIVWPDLDMVVVSMGGGNTGQIADAVRRAVKSEAPLPAAPDAAQHLQTQIAAAARPPEAEPTVALPPLAQSVSGAVYEFPVNPSRLDSLSLTFRNRSDATVTVKYYGQPFTFPIGLDGVYRVSPTGPMGLPGGAWGKWTSDREFLLDLNFVANINHYTLAILFQGDRIEVTADEASGLIRKGHLTGTRK